MGTPRLNKTTTDWHPEIKQLRSWLLITKMSVYKQQEEHLKLDAMNAIALKK